ncbi:MAG: ribonuclease D [Acidimicrobiia bacterium]|nr:ribonuclease D [Acidimicrobiia bacterium]
MITYDLIDTDADFETLVDKLRATPVWGFDTEFHRERTYYPKLALVQIASPHGLAVVDPFSVDVRGLAAAFEDSLVVVHAADQDLEILDVHVGTRPTRLFDTQIAAGFLGMDNPSLASLVNRALGADLPKGDRLTDWTRRPLSAAQLEYAAADVVHLLGLQETLATRLEAAGRLQWALDECAHLLAKRRIVRPPDETWWRLKGSRSLRGKAPAVAQAVCAWREREAERLDIPPRMILPDLAILALAQRPPTDREGLLAIRGVDARHLRKGADRRVLDAIRTGMDLPADRLRRPPAGESEGRLKPLITAVMGWVAQRAFDLDLNATLLATRSDVQALLEGAPATRLVDGWRKDVVGGSILRFAAGDAHLVVDGTTIRMV